MGNLRSWTCKGCTNVCYRLVPGQGVFEYCREFGKARREWVTDDYIDCLDKTYDPAATDHVIKIHHDFI